MKARIQIHKRNGPVRRPPPKVPLLHEPEWNEAQIREYFAEIQRQATRLESTLVAMQKSMLALSMNWGVLTSSKDGKGKPCKR